MKKSIFLILIYFLLCNLTIIAYLPPGEEEDSCDPPICSCESYEACTLGECDFECYFSWNEALKDLSQVPDSIVMKNLDQLSDELLGENLHGFNDLTMFSEKPDRLASALTSKFGLQEGFTIAFSDDLASGITISEEGIIENNGKTVDASLLTEFEGIGFLQYEFEEETYYGFSFFKGENSVEITGNFDNLIVNNDGNLQTGNVEIEVLGEGNIKFADSEIQFNDAYLTIDDDEIYGHGSFFTSAGEIDFSKPIELRGEKSYVCVDEKEHCASPSTDGPIKFCLECETDILETLHSELDARQIHGFVFWGEDINYDGSLTDAAVSRGYVTATYGKNGPITEGNHYDLEYDYLMLNLDENLHDIEFEFYGDNPPEGYLGSMSNGNTEMYLDSIYREGRYDGIHVFGTPDAPFSSTDRIFNEFNPFLQLEDKMFEIHRNGGLNVHNMDINAVNLQINTLKQYDEDGILEMPPNSGNMISIEDYEKYLLRWLDHLEEVPETPEENVWMHHESFRYDQFNDEDLDVENLYFSTGTSVLLEQREVAVSGIFDSYLNTKFQKNAWRDTYTYCSTADCSLEDMQDFFLDKQKLMSSELFVESQIHELNGIIEYIYSPYRVDMEGGTYKASDLDMFFGGLVSDDIKRWGFGNEEDMFDEIRDYQESLRGLDTIDALRMNGVSLIEINKEFGEDPNIAAALQLPEVKYTLGLDLIDDAIEKGMTGVTIGEIYYPLVKDSNFDRTLDESAVNNAKLDLLGNAAQSYLDSGLYDKSMELELQKLGFMIHLDMVDATAQNYEELIGSLATIGRTNGGVFSSTTYTHKYIEIGNEIFNVPRSLAPLLGKFDDETLINLFTASIEGRAELDKMKAASFVAEMIPDTTMEVAAALAMTLGGYALAGEAIIAKTSTGAVRFGKTALNFADIASQTFVGVGKDMFQLFGFGMADNLIDDVTRLSMDEIASNMLNDDNYRIISVSHGGRNIDILNYADGHGIDAIFELGTKMDDLPTGLPASMLDKISDTATVLKFPDGSFVVITDEMMEHFANTIAKQNTLSAEVRSQILTRNFNLEGDHVFSLLESGTPADVHIRIADSGWDDFNAFNTMLFDKSDPIADRLARMGKTPEDFFHPDSYDEIMDGAKAAGMEEDPFGWIEQSLRDESAKFSYCSETSCAMLGGRDYQHPYYSTAHTHPSLTDVVKPAPSPADERFIDTLSAKFDGNPYSNVQIIFTEESMTINKVLENGQQMNYVILIPDELKTVATAQ